MGLGADLGKVKKYTWMGDCIAKTVKEGGVLSLYNGIGPSTIGIVVYRGVQFGLQDTIKAFNPYQKDFTMIGIVSSSSWRRLLCLSLASLPIPSTPCSAVYKSRLASHRQSKCIAACLIASQRL